MNFSHLIQINDPSKPEIPPLSREQLWNGLVARAEKPKYFVFGLDECQILERGPTTLTRQLRFGNVLVRDRVTFEPQTQVQYEIESSKDMPGGRLLMRIEEPQPEQFFLRFDYQLDVAHAIDVDYYNEFRKSAYVEADIDTVRAIRELAAEGLL
ncbi:MAG: DUF1857 family protein [Gammaproteobacteria bacterium]|nr:DUF1857 family protein [Gammaproteobacteria bacterium]